MHCKMTFSDRLNIFLYSLLIGIIYVSSLYAVFGRSPIYLMIFIQQVTVFIHTSDDIHSHTW